MAGDSGQKFIRRNRAPRVHISYDDPYDANRKIELPFVMGVMADLSGNTSKVEKPDMNDRSFLDFDMDNFDKRMSAIEPGLSMKDAIPPAIDPEEDAEGFERVVVGFVVRLFARNLGDGNQGSAHRMLGVGAMDLLVALDALVITHIPHAGVDVAKPPLVGEPWIGRESPFRDGSVSRWSLCARDHPEGRSRD